MSRQGVQACRGDLWRWPAVVLSLGLTACVADPSLVELPILRVCTPAGGCQGDFTVVVLGDSSKADANDQSTLLLFAPFQEAEDPASLIAGLRLLDSLPGHQASGMDAERPGALVLELEDRTDRILAYTFRNPLLRSVDCDGIADPLRARLAAEDANPDRPSCACPGGDAVRLGPQRCPLPEEDDSNVARARVPLKLVQRWQRAGPEGPWALTDTSSTASISGYDELTTVRVTGS